jgi:hypothetical protein
MFQRPFVKLETLKLGVIDAVVTFSDGSITGTKVPQNIGIEPGQNMIKGFRAADRTHVDEAI